jgi:hypothetical protein
MDARVAHSWPEVFLGPQMKAVRTVRGSICVNLRLFAANHVFASVAFANKDYGPQMNAD